MKFEEYLTENKNSLDVIVDITNTLNNNAKTLKSEHAKKRLDKPNKVEYIEDKMIKLTQKLMKELI